MNLRLTSNGRVHSAGETSNPGSEELMMTWDHMIASVLPYLAIAIAVAGTVMTFAAYFH
jgi:hypothetical protein